jgi:MFS family permease
VTSGLRRYATLARVPDAWSMALPAFVARLPMAMTGLGLLVVTTAHGGSYAEAGVIAGGYGVAAAVTAPVRGRLIDRTGPRRALVVLGLAQALALLVFVAVARAQSPLWLRCAVAVVAGAFVSPVTAVTRMLWQHLLDSGELRDTAFAVESVAIEIVFVLSPLLVGALVALKAPDLVLVLSAGFVAGGNVALARARATRRWEQPEPSHDWLGPLRAPGVRLVLPVSFFAIGAVGALDLGAIASAGEHGQPAAVGLLVSALSLGSVTGGVYWGSRSQPGPLEAQLAVLLTVLAGGWAALALLPSLPVLAIGLAVAGLGLAPMATVLTSLMQRTAPPAHLAEALSWHAALANGGGSLAVAVAGAAVSRFHAPAAYLLSGILVATAALLALPLLVRART